MRNFLLFVLFIPAILWAQDDQKYLTGAVPEDNGKVVFSKEINAPSLSKDQIYDIMLAWAQGYFNGKDSRVVYSDKEKGDIAIVGEEYLVFKSTALSLDRSLMSYRFTIECENQLCKIKMNGIRYEYNVSYQKDPEKYIAEEWITDKYALNKNKTKLNRGNGKFREKTIDFAEKLLNDATAALGVQSIPATRLTPAIPAAATTPATPATPAVLAVLAAKDGFTAYQVDKIPEIILQLLPESAVQLSPNVSKDMKDSDVLWKGFSKMFGKNIASISISANSPAYKAINDNETYTISFMKKEAANKDVWFIIECSKQGETTEGSQKTMIGEVLSVWIK